MSKSPRGNIKAIKFDLILRSADATCEPFQCYSHAEWNFNANVESRTMRRSMPRAGNKCLFFFLSVVWFNFLTNSFRFSPGVRKTISAFRRTNSSFVVDGADRSPKRRRQNNSARHSFPIGFRFSYSAPLYRPTCPYALQLIIFLLTCH